MSNGKLIYIDYQSNINLFSKTKYGGTSEMIIHDNNQEISDVPL